MKKTVVFLLVVLLVTPIIYTLNARTTPSLTNLVGQMGDSSLITFIVNTAFVQDTIAGDNGSTVSIRGGGIFGDGSEETALKLINIGGDYWMGTLTTDQTQSGGTAKIVTQTKTGTCVDPVTIPDFAISGNKTLRLFTSGLKTTYTDPVTGLEHTRDMKWNPLEIATGETNTIAVHFRVNFQGNQTFPRETAEVYVRGSILDDSWSVLPEGRLYPEVRHDDLTGGYEADKFFYSRTVLVDRSKTGKNLEYKFTYNNGNETTWEEHSNRFVKLTGNDTTLAWVWFSNVMCQCPPFGNAIYDIQFEVDLFNAINTNGFDPATDTVVVRAGYASSGSSIKELTLDPPLFGTVYTGTMEDYDGHNNKYVAYQYFKVNGSQEQEEFYFDNFDETGTTTGPKFRKIPTPADTAGILVASDLLDDAVSTHRMPFFRNFNPVGANTSLIVEADLMPAICFVTVGEGSLEDLHGGSLVINAANIADYPVYINGPATGGWAEWDSVSLGDSRRMSDDGITRGDKVAGDNIWTITLYFADTATISQEYKLSIGGADNEGGFGNNHVANLFPKDVNNVSVQFGEIHPSRYENPGTGYWDFKDHSGPCAPGVGVDDDLTESISKFGLLPNYPNPFNPSTMIPFTVAKAGVVNFTVYNVLGQEVAAFDAEVPSAGTHQIPFTARNLASGTYLVKLQVGNHTDIIRILLTK